MDDALSGLDNHKNAKKAVLQAKKGDLKPLDKYIEGVEAQM